MEHFVKSQQIRLAIHLGQKKWHPIQKGRVRLCLWYMIHCNIRAAFLEDLVHAKSLAALCDVCGHH